MFSISLFVSNVTAQDAPLQWQPTPSNHSLMVHGGTGLIQTPTSRMLPLGDLRTSYTDNDEYRFISVTLQLYPWMQSTVRYTDVRTRLFSSSVDFSGDQTLKDKGIDVKFRLHEESYYLPELSVGFRDFGGTGFFESEFIGLSKKAGPFDFHLNLGWGYLGSHGDINNPFCKIKDSFCERPVGFQGLGGKIDYQRFFKGNVAIFGGVKYQTPLENLSLKLEYEGNNYKNDRAGILEQKSRWNFGATYQWGDLDLSLNYQRGNTIGFGLTYNFNLQNIKPIIPIKINKPPKKLSSHENNIDINEIDHSRLSKDLYELAGFRLNSFHNNGNSITIYGKQVSYRNEKEAIDRIGRVLASFLPDIIETYHVVSTSGTVPIVEVEIDAKQFKTQAKYETLQHNLSSTYKRKTPAKTSLDDYDLDKTSGFFTRLETFWLQTFGNPETFYIYQGGVIGSGGYSFNGKTSIFGAVKVSLVDNYDKFNFTRDSQNTPLHRVRTDVRKYISGNRVSMERLYIHHKDRLAPNLYGQLYGGYLETMYAGVGGELLYRPVDSNLSVGIDINYVQQRSYENDFDLFKYKVLTGHVNVYWQPEILSDTLITFKVGQFLAKDKGVTVDFAKRFDSGVVVGAYASFTNVSSEEYGEGSFTKGFYISLPLDLFTVEPAKGRGNIPWIPIARDGGRPLNRPVNLYNVTEDRSPFFR